MAKFFYLIYYSWLRFGVDAGSLISLHSLENTEKECGARLERHRCPTPEIYIYTKWGPYYSLSLCVTHWCPLIMGGTILPTTAQLLGLVLETLFYGGRYY